MKVTFFFLCVVCVGFIYIFLVYLQFCPLKLHLYKCGRWRASMVRSRPSPGISPVAVRPRRVQPRARCEQRGKEGVPAVCMCTVHTALPLLSLTCPLAGELPMHDGVFPFRLHFFNGELAGAVVLLLDASEDGGVLALDAVELLLPAADVERLGLAPGSGRLAELQRLSIAILTLHALPGVAARIHLKARTRLETGSSCFTKGSGSQVGDSFDCWVGWYNMHRPLYRPLSPLLPCARRFWRGCGGAACSGVRSP